MSELIQRIPKPTVTRLPPPVTSRMQDPVVDFLVPPVVNVPSYDPPELEIPTYDPPVVVPAPNIGGATNEEESGESDSNRPELETPVPNIPTVPTVPPPRPEIALPVVGDVPLPYMGEVMLAGTTAVGATIATLVGKSMVEQLLKAFKPLAKKIILKIKDATGKRFNDYELQEYFDFEGEKALKKHLEKEKKKAKAKQLEVFQERQHQRKR